MNVLGQKYFLLVPELNSTLMSHIFAVKAKKASRSTASNKHACLEFCCDALVSPFVRCWFQKIQTYSFQLAHCL